MAALDKIRLLSTLFFQREEGSKSKCEIGRQGNVTSEKFNTNKETEEEVQFNDIETKPRVKSDKVIK